MLALLMVLAAAPEVDVEADAPQVAIWAGVSYANSVAPGAHVSLNVGAKLRTGLLGFGLEGAVFAPGSDEIGDSRYYQSVFAKVGLCTSTPCVKTISGYALTATTTACLQPGIFSACAVVSGGVSSSRLPIFSAGARVGVEAPLTDAFAVLLNVQLLGNLVRPDVDVWQASLIQFGITFGLAYLR